MGKGLFEVFVLTGCKKNYRMVANLTVDGSPPVFLLFHLNVHGSHFRLLSVLQNVYHGCKGKFIFFQPGLLLVHLVFATVPVKSEGLPKTTDLKFSPYSASFQCI